MDYQKLRDTRNSTNPFAQRLGIFVEEIGPGYARAVKDITPESGELPAGGRGPGGPGGEIPAADLSETFTLSDGGNFFTGVSPLEAAEAAEAGTAEPAA